MRSRRALQIPLNHKRSFFFCGWGGGGGEVGDSQKDGSCDRTPVYLSFQKMRCTVVGPLIIEKKIQNDQPQNQMAD